MITLAINKLGVGGEEYQFSISYPDGSLMSIKTRISASTLGAIIQPFIKAASRQSVLDRDFASAGELIYSLFPDEIQEHLERCQEEPILIQTNDSSIPWELCHDSDNFQGLARPIGRMPILEKFIKRSRRRAMEPGARPSVLIIANPGRGTPDFDLPEADQEAEALVKFLAGQGCRVHLLAGPLATKFEVCAHLKGKHSLYDIIHFAGHAVPGEGNGNTTASLVLADDTLTPNEINRFVHGSPVVFLNACHTITTKSPVNGTAGRDTAGFSYEVGSSNSRDLAEAFIMGNNKGNASILIGTLFRNDDTRSKELALSFYRSLLEGSTFGESLRKAREQIFAPDDVTWASYVLYGLPSQGLFRSVPSEPSKDDGPGTREERQEEDSDAAEDEQAGLRAEILGDTAREALLNALRVWGNSAFRMVVTPSLFVGMAEIAGSYTRRFLGTGQQPPETVINLFRTAMQQIGSDGTASGELGGVSDRVGALFVLAREYAALDGDNGLIEEKHLLQAFFENGGGMTASLLSSLGIQMPPRDREAILALELFADSGKSGTGKPEHDPGPQPDQKQGSPDEPRLASSGRRAIEAAFAEARAGGQPVLTTPHLLMGVMVVDQQGFGLLVQQAGVSLELLRQTLRSVLPKGEPFTIDNVGVTPRFHGILKQAVALAEQTGRVPDVRHLAMAILQDGLRDAESITLKVLRHCGLDPEELLEHLQIITNLKSDSFPESKTHQAGVRTAAKSVSKEEPDRVSPGDRDTPVLDTLGRDLVRLAGEGKLDEIVGREEEIDALVEILLRKSKACPVLIGEAGVGKTAIVEGFARQAAAGQLPSALSGIRLIEVPISSLVAGTRYRGDFEERLQNLLDEVQRSGNVVLFFDELHTIIGAGGSGEGAMHAGDILKPALARGELKCIGATTSEEYRRWIESDPALERRFSPVMVEEPSPEQAVEILRGLRPGLEHHHLVAIPDEILETAVRLSCDSLIHRRLPDKAIDLLDQACARTQRLQVKTDAETKRPRVTLRVLREVLAKLSGVPAPEDMKGEPEKFSRKMRQLAEDLSREVMGQPQAIDALVRAVAVIETGMREEQKPGGVLLFTGPVGVGKSSLAKAFARLQDRPLVRLDMGEYGEPHQVARLIGSPPGYIGYGREGYLTGRLRSTPRCVVLLDEVEKAHPEVLRLFLRLFDEGGITDAKGRTVDGRKAIFIMTSNLGPGAQAGQPTRPMGFGIGTEAGNGPEWQVDRKLLEKTLSTEFVDRIDTVIAFQPLDRAAMLAITRHLLAAVRDRFVERHGVDLRIGEETAAFIARKGGPGGGVRPLQRFIDDHLTTPLAEQVVDGHWQEGTAVQVVVEEDRLVFQGT